MVRRKTKDHLAGTLGLGSEHFMTRTNVFATPEETKLIIEMHAAAQKTPVMLIGGVDASASAWNRLRQHVHAVALSKGLPEITGFYGFDGENGEFVTA